MIINQKMGRFMDIHSYTLGIHESLGIQMIQPIVK
jgi:hypothetical protein